MSLPTPSRLEGSQAKHAAFTRRGVFPQPSIFVQPPKPCATRKVEGSDSWGHQFVGEPAKRKRPPHPPKRPTANEIRRFPQRILCQAGGRCGLDFLGHPWRSVGQLNSLSSSRLGRIRSPHALANLDSWEALEGILVGTVSNGSHGLIGYLLGVSFWMASHQGTQSHPPATPNSEVVLIRLQAHLSPFSHSDPNNNRFMFDLHP